MNKPAKVTFESILGGWSQTQYQGKKDTYQSSIAIDPDFPIGTDVRTSGMICPTVYEKFSSTNVTGFPKWILSNIKDEYIYTYMSDGKFVSYDNTLASETLIGTPTSGAGNGGAYYNNYIYLATPTDVSRYGPLSSSPTLVNNAWTGSTLGSLTALTNTTYPSLRGTPIPNHPMHVHVDNCLYVGDVSNGQGIINKINTKKTTYEGDTNDGSAYNALDLPFGYWPTDIESYGTDLVILAIQTSSVVLNQGRAALFFWDCVSDSFYRVVKIPDPIGTALLNNNGILYIFSGNAVNGVRISYYSGGDSIKDSVYLEEGTPPFAGAVDDLGNRIVFGGWTTQPTASASVFAYGSKKADLPETLHNIVKTSSTGAIGTVTAVKFVQQSSNVKPQVIAGWGDASTYGIDKLSTSGTYASVWRSNVISVGMSFDIQEIRIPLGATLASGMTIVPKVYLDDGSTVKTMTTINSTNFDGRYAIFKRPEINDYSGSNNFYIELTFQGTTYCPVLLPLKIEIDIHQDEA